MYLNAYALTQTYFILGEKIKIKFQKQIKIILIENIFAFVCSFNFLALKRYQLKIIFSKTCRLLTHINSNSKMNYQSFFSLAIKSFSTQMGKKRGGVKYYEINESHGK